jgi:hypothetical protein
MLKSEERKGRINKERKKEEKYENGLMNHCVSPGFG